MKKIIMIVLIIITLLTVNPVSSFYGSGVTFTNLMEYNYHVRQQYIKIGIPYSVFKVDYLP